MLGEAPHTIDIQEGKDPPWGPIYPLSPDQRKELEAYLKTKLELGRIRPSTSLAGAPVLFVPKKDGGLRLRVDY